MRQSAISVRISIKILSQKYTLIVGLMSALGSSILLVERTRMDSLATAYSFFMGYGNLSLLFGNMNVKAKISRGKSQLLLAMKELAVKA